VSHVLDLQAIEVPYPVQAIDYASTHSVLFCETFFSNLSLVLCH
jgi:Lanthionine-containing peptide SapB precursor RamS